MREVSRIENRPRRATREVQSGGQTRGRVSEHLYSQIMRPVADAEFTALLAGLSDMFDAPPSTRVKKVTEPQDEVSTEKVQTEASSESVGKPGNAPKPDGGSPHPLQAETFRSGRGGPGGEKHKNNNKAVRGRRGGNHATGTSGIARY